MMDQNTKDVIDAISKIGSSLGLFVAIFVAYFQVKKNREERQTQLVKDRAQREKELAEAINERQQRELELRWRKASLAREVLDKLWNDPYSADAMLMLDWSGRQYKIDEGITEEISEAETWRALRTEPLDFNTKESYVRDCFDTFFGMMETTEHYLRINLLVFEDVEFPFNYFAGKLAKRGEVVELFLTKYEYRRAIAFLNRLDNWKNKTHP
jgi:hypothetical protein